MLLSFYAVFIFIYLFAIFLLRCSFLATMTAAPPDAVQP